MLINSFKSFLIEGFLLLCLLFLAQLQCLYFLCSFCWRKVPCSIVKDVCYAWRAREGWFGHQEFLVVLDPLDRFWILQLLELFLKTLHTCLHSWLYLYINCYLLLLLLYLDFSWRCLWNQTMRSSLTVGDLRQYAIDIDDGIVRIIMNFEWSMIWESSISVGSFERVLAIWSLLAPFIVLHQFVLGISSGNSCEICFLFDFTLKRSSAPCILSNAILFSDGAVLDAVLSWNDVSASVL